MFHFIFVNFYISVSKFFDKLIESGLAAMVPPVRSDSDEATLVEASGEQVSPIVKNGSSLRQKGFLSMQERRSPNGTPAESEVGRSPKPPPLPEASSSDSGASSAVHPAGAMRPAGQTSTNPADYNTDESEKFI